MLRGAAEWRETSVMCMIILMMNCSGRLPSMRPISGLTDCQPGWLWTEETAVKNAPLPLTRGPLQGGGVAAARR